MKRVKTKRAKQKAAPEAAVPPADPEPCDEQGHCGLADMAAALSAPPLLGDRLMERLVEIKGSISRLQNEVMHVNQRLELARIEEKSILDQLTVIKS